MEDNKIKFFDGIYGLEYERYYIVKDRGDSVPDAIVLVFKFTNNSGSTYREPIITWFMKMEVFQHGISLDEASCIDDALIKNVRNRCVQTGYTIPFAIAYDLQDMSDVTIEVYYGDKTRVQTIHMPEGAPAKPPLPEITDTPQTDLDDFEETANDTFEREVESIIDDTLSYADDYEDAIEQLDDELRDRIMFHGGNPFDMNDFKQGFFGNFDFDKDED